MNSGKSLHKRNSGNEGKKRKVGGIKKLRRLKKDVE